MGKGYLGCNPASMDSYHMVEFEYVSVTYQLVQILMRLLIFFYFIYLKL